MEVHLKGGGQEDCLFEAKQGYRVTLDRQMLYNDSLSENLEHFHNAWPDPAEEGFSVKY